MLPLLLLPQVVTVLSCVDWIYSQLLEFHSCDQLPPAFQPWYADKVASERLCATGLPRTT